MVSYFGVFEVNTTTASSFCYNTLHYTALHCTAPDLLSAHTNLPPYLWASMYEACFCQLCSFQDTQEHQGH